MDDDRREALSLSSVVHDAKLEAVREAHSCSHSRVHQQTRASVLRKLDSGHGMLKSMQGLAMQRGSLWGLCRTTRVGPKLHYSDSYRNTAIARQR